MSKHHMRQIRTVLLTPVDWFLPMLRLCINLVDKLHGAEVNDESRHLVDAHSLAKKTVIHLISLHRLQEPISSNVYATYQAVNTSAAIDHASGNVLLRAALEAYLTFSYLYLGSVCEEVEARRLSWRMSALLFRQGFDPVGEQDFQKKIDEGHKLVALRDSLDQNTYFKSAGHKKRKHLQNGRWDFELSWNDLAGMAGFDELWFKKLYGYLCAYAHSGYLTAMQINTATSKEDQQWLAEFSLRSALPLLSKFILHYPTLFPETSVVRNCSPFAFRAAKMHDMTSDLSLRTS